MTHADLWNLPRMSSLWKLGWEEFIKHLWVAHTGNARLLAKKSSAKLNRFQILILQHAHNH